MEQNPMEGAFDKDITDQDKIIQLLNDLFSKKNKKKFLEQLLLFFPILSPNICETYKIHKKKTEKETLFDVINDLIKNFGKNECRNEDPKNEKIYKYVKDILEKPAKEELKDLDLNPIPSRWNIIYSKVIRIESEANEELIYYNATNDILQNIKTNKSPYDIIEFLKHFMEIYNKLPWKNEIKNNTKKFILLGLINCEFDYETESKDFISIFSSLLKKIRFPFEFVEEFIISPLLNEKDKKGCLLNDCILKFSNSNLAKDAFKIIFNKESIPLDLEKELFTDNIQKYICYFPYSSSYDTERTSKRFSLILINNYKRKSIFPLNLKKLEILLDDFIFIVVRKYIFGHEHQHLSGGLLFHSGVIDRIGTPTHNEEEIKNGNVKYNMDKAERGERGEIFEKICYDKVYHTYSLFDLLFIANENNDELDVATHLKIFKEYKEKEKHKKLDLMNELKNFPKGQVLSELISKIYTEILRLPEKERLDKIKELSNEAIAYKKEGEFSRDYYIDFLENNNIATNEYCPLKNNKQNYRHTNNTVELYE